MFQFALYTSYGGTLLKDWSFKARTIQFSTNEFGFARCTATIDTNLHEISDFYKWKGLAYLRIGDASNVLWEGRLEDIEFTNTGLKLTAYGYIRAFTDVRFSELWSTTKYDKFFVISSDELTTVQDQWFTADTNNRLYAAFNKNSSPTSAVQYIFRRSIPNKAVRQINAVSFIVNIRNKPSANLTIAVDLRDDSYVFQTNAYARVGAGIIGSGLREVITSFPVVPANHIFFRTQESTTGLFAGETDDISTRYTNMRIGTTPSISGAVLYADEVLKFTISGVYSLNPTQISTDYSYILSPGFDITDLEYEDLTGLDIIKLLLTYPDSAGFLYECQVWENQKVYFRRKGTVTKEWFIDISEIHLNKILDSIQNSVQASYAKPDGNEVLRTSASTDSDSVTKYGLTRENTVQADTTSLSFANSVRDAYLTDNKNIRNQTNVIVPHVFNQYGVAVPSYFVRSGHYVTIRNIAPTLFDQSFIRFRISETQYDFDTGMNTLTPELPLPALDKLLARR